MPRSPNAEDVPVQAAAPTSGSDAQDVQQLLAAVAAEHNRRIAADSNGAARHSQNGMAAPMAPVAARCRKLSLGLLLAACRNVWLLRLQNGCMTAQRTFRPSMHAISSAKG